MKVTTANTQWSRPKMATLKTLESDMIRTMWGKHRTLRSAEIVTGLLHKATDLSPTKAMAWAAISNARRIMLKNPSIALTTIEAVRTREQRGDKASLTTEEVEWPSRARKITKPKHPKPKPAPKTSRAPRNSNSKRKSRAMPLQQLVEAAEKRAEKKRAQILPESHYQIHGCSRCRYRPGCSASCRKHREDRRSELPFSRLPV